MAFRPALATGRRSKVRGAKYFMAMAFLTCLSLAACGSEGDTRVEYERFVADRSFEAGPCLGLVRGADRDRPDDARTLITVSRIEQVISDHLLEYEVIGLVVDTASGMSRTYEWSCEVIVDTRAESLGATLTAIRQVD
jgi:hypothetical protein